MRVSDALQMLRNDGDEYPATDLIPDPSYDPVADMHPGAIDPDDIIDPADDEEDRGDDDDCDPDPDPDADDEECRCESDTTGSYHRQFVVGGV